MPIIKRKMPERPAPIADAEENLLLDYRMWLISKGFTLSPRPDDGAYSGSYVTGVRRFFDFLQEDKMFLHMHHDGPVTYPETGQCPHPECEQTRQEIEILTKEIVTKPNGHTTTCTCDPENDNPNIVKGEN
jgi:hypothetical protein